MEDIMEGLIKYLRYIWETSEKESTKEMENEVEEDNRDCGINMTDLWKGLKLCRYKRNDLNKNFG